MVAYFQAVVGLGSVVFISIHLDRGLNQANARSKLSVILFTLGTLATAFSVGFSLFALWHLGDGNSWEEATSLFRYLSVVSGAGLVGTLLGQVTVGVTTLRERKHELTENEKSQQALNQAKEEFERFKQKWDTKGPKKP
ncbi:hypothetical protein RAE13_10135 [Corynebacterium curieae]|uniref:Uncharacterized protein n=1 Tax=Corynebacterium curieae TaxID=2913500 RepID=A0ABU3W9M5_9CORY|nr:hypothetical protein [Corynebacterium curieae]MDV2424762.1 hypothetical protein [Corynebacterium curieae]